MSENNLTTSPIRIFWRYPGEYGMKPPSIVQATIVKRYNHWSGERLIIQPDGGLALRDIPVSDVRQFDWKAQQ